MQRGGENGRKEDPPENQEDAERYTDEYKEYNKNDNSYVLNAVEVIPSGATSRRDPDGGPTVANFKDHFTLTIPSSVVRFRNSRGAARVIQGNDYQFILEESYNKEKKTNDMTIRRIIDSTEGLRLLRISYTIVCAFWAGFLFVFGLQILLFLFLDLAIQLGVSDRKEATGIGAIGALLGIFPLIQGLASAMVLAGAFIMDTFRGHQLVRNFTLRHFSSTTVEWIFFSFFLGLPLLVMCGALLSRKDDWWAITGVFWVSSVALFFVLFTLNVLFYEMRACMEVMRNLYKDDDDSFFPAAKRSILLRQIATYGGSQNRSYVSRGRIDNSEYTDKKSSNDMVEGSLRENVDLRARIGFLFEKVGWFEELKEGKRYYSVDDARDVRPFITSHTWSLEKLFCRSRNSRYIAIIRGSGAITRAQMKSSMACSLLGSFLIFLVILSAMVFLGAGAAGTGFMLVIAIIFSIPNFISTYRLYAVGKNIIEARTEIKREENLRRSVSSNHQDVEEVNPANSESEGLYLVNESYRVTRPSKTCAWVFFWIEVILVFIWPTASLFGVGNWPLAIVYFFIVGVTGVRHYLNAAVVMEEVGNLDLVHGTTERETWRSQSRLDDIVGNVTRGRTRGAWTMIISIVALAYLGLFAGAVYNPEDKETEESQYTYLKDFEYLPFTNSLRYPTCRITSDLQQSPLVDMADYVFLARVAYRGKITQQELDSWFGEGVAIDQAELVSEYRAANNVNSQVSFKLITHPNNSPDSDDSRDFAYLAIRGTTNQWEALTDAQLWSPAFMMQFLRELLPFGSIWTQVMPAFIKALTTIESNSIEDISFYKDTVNFAEYLKSSDYSGVTVAGHSLGGGLSMITGAMAQLPGIALSGPNTVLTRRSLEPPLSTEELDRYTFNIIPERDVVPMIDDRAQNYQIIRCNADYTDVIGCHDTTRALCEIIYTCGSNGRPVPCACKNLGFPEPLPIDPNSGISFAEACEGKK